MDDYKMINTDDISSAMIKIGSFVANAAFFLFRSFKRFWFLFIVIFAGVTSCCIVYQRSKPFLYQSDAALMFNSLGRHTFGEMIVKLNNLIASHSYHTLSEELNISLSEAHSLYSIDAKNMNGTPVSTDFSDNKAPLFITVKASESLVLKHLQKGLVAYLNNSPFRQQRNKAELTKQELKILFLTRDLALTDSTINAYNEYLKHTGSLDSSKRLGDIATLFRYRDSIEEKIETAEWRKVELVQTVEILHGFLRPESPSREPSALSNLAVFLTSFIAASFAVMFCSVVVRKRKNHRVNSYEEQDIIV